MFYPLVTELWRIFDGVETWVFPVIPMVLTEVTDFFLFWNIERKRIKYIDKKIYSIHVYIEIEKSPSKSVIGPSKQVISRV